MLSTRSGILTIFRTIYPAPCPRNGACRLAPCNIYTEIRAANNMVERPVKLHTAPADHSVGCQSSEAREVELPRCWAFLSERWSGCVKRGAINSISRARLKRTFARLASPMELAWMLESHLTHCEDFVPIGCMTSDEDQALSGGFVLLLRSLND
jgi:hypothetical protein